MPAPELAAGSADVRAHFTAYGGGDVFGFQCGKEGLHQMMGLTDQSLTQMNRLMLGRKESFDVNRSFNIEHEINNYRNQLKSQNITDVNNHEYTYAVGTIYMDIINECEKLADYVVNVVEARMGLR